MEDKPCSLRLVLHQIVGYDAARLRNDHPITALTDEAHLIHCPLCNSNQIAHFHMDKWREYVRCQICQLISVPSKFHLSSTAEKAEYDLHQNSQDDEGYRRFLSRLFKPVHERIAPASHGLDFGSGPGPTLSVMFEEAGHHMAIYDPFYAPDEAPLSLQYDFVTASEVVEHFRTPQEDLARIWGCVKPGGLLGIMTKLALNTDGAADAFARWHYKNDRTHVSFYSRATFAWIAAQWGTEAVFVGNDVVLFRKRK